MHHEIDPWKDTMSLTNQLIICVECLLTTHWRAQSIIKDDRSTEEVWSEARSLDVMAKRRSGCGIEL
jgi:hypothetical protein